MSNVYQYELLNTTIKVLNFNIVYVIDGTLLIHRKSIDR